MILKVLRFLIHDSKDIWCANLYFVHIVQEYICFFIIIKVSLASNILKSLKGSFAKMLLLDNASLIIIFHYYFVSILMKHLNNYSNNVVLKRYSEFTFYVFKMSENRKKVLVLNYADHE